METLCKSLRKEYAADSGATCLESQALCTWRLKDWEFKVILEFVENEATLDYG